MGSVPFSALFAYYHADWIILGALCNLLPLLALAYLFIAFYKPNHRNKR